MAAKLRTTVTDPRLIDASISELEITYLFLQWEEDRWFYRWERMLGLVWEPEDLAALAESAEKQQQKTPMSPQQLEASAPVDEKPRTLRYPLSLLIRPELMKNLQDHAIPGGLGMSHVPKDASSLFASSKEDFLRRMGATAATGGSDISDRFNVDPYGPSRGKPAGGFAEGRQRTLSGGGKRK